ncbi:O-antigen ligase family protein [Phenylobacterium aquaticum]|uniref:O-antigen ligase family protein n=1 Tax=Phenylobacterium aquaticum TaxID=1763816 RepID=UPI001F5D3D4F|nr:O-antigen ligase family protein [Phenylobacterium aquaticum]
MTEAAVAPTDRLAAWCGWVLVGAFVLAVPFGWLAPRGYAAVTALAGLLMLPSLTLEEQDRPAGIAIITLLIWAVGSAIWSPYTPKNIGESSSVKLLFETVLYASVIAGARRTTAGGRIGLLRTLAWGMTLLALIMLGEGLTYASGYRAIRDAMGDPIRPDLGVKNVCQGLFGLTLLAPAAILAARRFGGTVWLGAPILVGIILPSVVFGYDAPLLGLGAAAIVGLAVWAWPRWGPRVAAILTAAIYLTAPALVWAARAAGVYQQLEHAVPLSWSERMGYWRHASDWISDHPARGWGLDSSKMFGPGIILHPHDGPLQIWLELGLIGAVGAAVFWVALWNGLSRKSRDPAAAVGAATATIYLVFGAFSFGVWQEWWLALGALAATACVALLRTPAEARAPRASRAARSRSTIAVFTE